MLDLKAIRRLKSLQPELTSSGIAALYLFGSHARDQARPDSDIDLAFDVREGTGFNLIDQGRIKSQIEKLLDRQVDFVSREGMRPKMRARVEAEMIRIL